MSQYVETPCRSDIAAGAIGAYLRVKTPGALVVATATDSMHGSTDSPILAAGPCSVRLRNAPGTRKLTASGAITAGNLVYAAAGGKIASTGTIVEGRALETCTTDGDIIEVASANGVVAPVAGVASGYKMARGQATTVTASDTIVTGLATVVSVVACMDDNPGDDPMLVSASIGDQAGTPAAGSFLLKTWKNTGGTDPTPLAATTFSKKVNWIAIGT